MMAKWLIKGSYTIDGLKGLLKEGGTKRVAAAEQLAQALGGEIEAFYFAFGENDFYIIVGGVDEEDINVVGQTAGMLILNASGAVTANSTLLLTPEEVDEATKRTASYRPPGQ
jgi:uncharacterized protein with GYD domain